MRLGWRRRLWARAAVAVGKARAAAVAVVAAAAARARAAAAARAAEAWAAEAWATTTTAVRAAAAGWGGGVGWGVRGLPHRHVPRCRNGVVIDSVRARLLLGRMQRCDHRSYRARCVPSFTSPFLSSANCLVVGCTFNLTAAAGGRLGPPRGGVRSWGEVCPSKSAINCP